MQDSYETWIQDVGKTLQSINMRMEDWQGNWAFDFHSEFTAGTTANEAAIKANRYWWYRQNQAIGQNCLNTPNCWLPQGHRGECEPCF